MKSKFLKHFGKAVFGRTEPEEKEQEPLIKSDPPPKLDKEKFLRKFMRRRAPKRRNQFADKRMTRGVQMALERAQRPARLAFIYESMRQANEITKKHRAEYVARRSHRWRNLFEVHAPRMFEQELEQLNLIGPRIGEPDFS